MRSTASLILSLALAGFTSQARAQGADPEVERGVQLVKQGEYGQAILVLDAAARRLAARGSARDRVQAANAYLNLGVAYVGEGQDRLAVSSFREALTRNDAIQLSAMDVSPKVRDLFQQARDQLAQQKLAATPPPKKGGGKGPLLLVGLLALGGGGAAVALGGGGGDGGGGSSGGGRSITISTNADCTTAPNSQCTQVVGIPVRFSTGSASTVSWDFGDGSSGSGTNVSHAYNSEGTFTVAATTEGETVRTTVSVRSLTGTWDADTVEGRFVVQISHSGTTLTGSAEGESFTGSLSDSRNALVSPACGVQTTQFTIGATVATMGPSAGFLPCRRQGPIMTTLTRR